MLLAINNKHERDQFITFKEEGHEYTVTLNDQIIKPISVTTMIHHHFPQFNPDAIIDKMMRSNKWSQSKYFGKTKEEIKKEWEDNGKNASGSGTEMHADIERFLNTEPVKNPNSKEFSFFMNFWNGFQEKYPSFKPYRTEWLVFDEDKKLAGSIDCVLADDKGNLLILDWKRSKEIKMTNNFEKGFEPFEKLDNCNFSHYSIQLNVYRHILETKYNKKVLALMLVILHPNMDNFQCIPVNKMDIAGVWSKLKC